MTAIIKATLTKATGLRVKQKSYNTFFGSSEIAKTLLLLLYNSLNSKIVTEKQTSALHLQQKIGKNKKHNTRTRFFICHYWPEINSRKQTKQDKQRNHKNNIKLLQACYLSTIQSCGAHDQFGKDTHTRQTS